MPSLAALAALTAVISQAVMSYPLMDMLLKIPELSTYAHVYNITGGIVEINPLFTKRFNYDEDKRNYTFLAPTNAVSSINSTNLRQYMPNPLNRPGLRFLMPSSRTS